MNILEITHRWEDVQSSLGCNYFHPSPVSPHMKKQYCGPAVYRWMVWTPGDRIYAYYIGETDDLSRRIQQCVSPGNSQTTNLRLKAYFEEAANHKQRVELQTLVFEPFQVNRVKFSMDLLRHTHIRRTLENLVLVWMNAENPSGVPVILNRVLEQDKVRSKKRMDEALLALKHLGVPDAQALLDKLKIASA